MADIRLDFGVDKGVSKINIEKDLTDIVNQLPTFGIKVGVNAESLQEFKAQLESTKEQINGLKDFQLNLGGANVAIQSAGELDEAIKKISTDLSSITSFEWTKWDSSKEVVTFSTALERVYKIIEDIGHAATAVSLTLARAFEDGSGKAHTVVEFGKIFENLGTTVKNALGDFKVKGTVTESLRELNSYIRDIHMSLLQLDPKSESGLSIISLSSYFEDMKKSVDDLGTSLEKLKADFRDIFKDPEFDTLSIKLGQEFANIKTAIANQRTEIYTSSDSWFGSLEADSVREISKNIETLTTQLSEIPKILSQISALVDTISKKDFNVTNNFTGNLENLKDKAQETRLYRDRLLELYKVVREYNTEAERMVQQRYVNGEANKIFQQIPGTGMSNIFEMIQQLDELGMSERSIYSMSNMKSIEAKMGRLNELKGIYETLFQEVQKYQQAESNSALAKSGFKINAPDMTAFQKATEALDTYQNKITEIKAAAADAAAKQLSSNQDKERLEAAKQIAAVVEQSLATPQQQLNEIQTKLTETFDLSKISPNAEKITQTLSGIDQQLGNIKTQIRTTFDLSGVDFNTSKITAGTDIIKSRLTEIQGQIGSIFDPSKINPEAMNQMATAARNAVNLTGENLDTSKFTAFTTEVSQQLVRIQNQIRNTFNTSNLVIDTAKFDDFTRHVFSELVRTQNQLRETFNGAKLVVDTAKVGDFTTEVKRQIAEVKAEIATIFDLSGVTFDYTQFDAFTGRIKSGFDEIRTSVKGSLDGIKAYINEVTGAYANLLVQIDKAANNPVVQKVANSAIPASQDAQRVQQATAVRDLAQAHVELGQAETQAAKAANQQEMAETKKLAIARVLFNTEEQLAALVAQNAMDERLEYDSLRSALLSVSEAADIVREDINQVDVVFKDKADKTTTYLSRVRTEIAAYKAELKKFEIGGVVTPTQFYSAMGSLKKIETSYPEKKGVQVYDEIIHKLNELRIAEELVTENGLNLNEAFNELGMSSAKGFFEEINALIKEFNAQITGEASIKDISAQITSLTSAIASAKNAEKNGKLGIIDSAQFKQVETIVENFKAALRSIRDDGKTSSEAFSEFGLTVTQAFDNAKISISDLKTLLNETEKVVKESNIKIFDASALEKSIAKMQGLANQALRDPNAKKTKEYLDLANHLNLANQAFEALKQNELTAEQALAQYGTNGTEYVRDLTAVVDAFNIVLKKTANETIKSNNAAKAQAQAAKEAEAEQKKLNQTQAEALANAKRLKEAYLQVLRMQSSMVTSLNSAGNKNSALKGSNEYQAVQNYLNQFKSATATMASENLNIFDAFTSIGGNFENAVLRANEAMAQLKIVTGETAKETKDAEAKVTSLAKAYDALARANRLINNNQNLKNTAEYTSLVRNRDEMQHMVDLLENGVKTVGGYRQQYTSLDDVFQQLNVDGERLFENLRVSASRFNNEIAKTEKSITLDAAYKKLGSLQDLLNGKKGKTLIGTDEYNAVLDSVNQLATAIAKAESQQISMNQAFEQMGVTSKDALGQMNLAAEKMKILLDSTQVTDIKTAWQEVQSATRLLNNNQSMAGDTTYQKLKSDVELMAKAIEEARKNNTTLDVQLQQLGRDGKQALDNIRLGALDLKAAMDGIGVSGTTTEVKLERAMNSLKKLQADADKYQGYSFNLNGSPAVIEQTEQYTKLQAQIQTVAKALDLMRNSGLSADEALVQLRTTGTELFGDIELNSVRMKGAIDQVAQAYKNATAGSRVANQEEKKRQELIARAYSLMSKSQKISANWTMAATGKSADSYRQIQGYANALGNLISQFKNGSMTAADFERQLAAIDAGLKQGTATIQAAGENAASLSLKLNNVFQRFSAWFGATRIIMKVITSIKQMISTSIELDDAFTQLQIVTKDTEASYESFGSTVAKIARETAVSMKDITDAATTFARLGYNLEDAAKLAEYTAKLQNVGDIETQEAQDAITSILKAYDDVDAEHIEEVMDKLVTTGKYNCPTVW